MKKLFKKMLSLVMALAMVVGVFASMSNVFAESITPGKSVYASYQDVNQRIFGTINLKDYVLEDGKVFDDNGRKIYRGTLGGEIEAHDLFEDALETFKRDFEGKTSIGFPAEHIVMYGADKGFPTCNYKIELPSNVVVDKSKIEVSEESGAISKIYVSPNDPENVVTVVIQLGNWNDYAGFFELVEKEINKPGHLIKVEVPFEIDASNANPGYTLATIKSKGDCKLYYNGRWSFLPKYKKPIVDIAAKEILHDVIYK